MTDREVLYVSTIAECHSITKAAEELFIAQPSLTQALHRIESEYSAPFFYRVRSGLQLTEAGKTYLEAAKEIDNLYKNMEFEVGDVTGMQCGRIRFGITVFQGGVILPQILTLYRQRYPKIFLSLLEASSAELEELAANGKLDMVILHRPFRKYDLNYLSLHREDFFLAVSKDNPDYLEASDGGRRMPMLTREIFQRQKFIMQTANQRVRQVADSVCAKMQISPTITFSTSSVETSLSLASKGFGASFIPASLARYYTRYSPAFFCFPPEWDARWELVVAYSKNAVLPRPCLELFNICQECVTSMTEVFK